MYKPLTTRIIGTAPFVMHNGQLADPLNRIAKQLKAVTTKKRKTEADHAEAARIEFLGGLYMDKDGPVIPALMITKMIIEGARKTKSGKQAEAGVIVDKNCRLDYDGPRDGPTLFSDDQFRLSVMVKNPGQSGRVPRNRPIFPNWSATIEVEYLPDIINEQDLIAAIRTAGIYVGIGDWRPRYGRFALEADMAALPKAA